MALGGRTGRKQRRLVLIGAVGSVLAVAAGLVLFALSDTITLFMTPTEIAEQTVPTNEHIRLGGLVKDGSWVREGTSHTFLVTDTANDVPIQYTGIVPDLFREGQGVVLEGRIRQDGQFIADKVLAKHDENYMPAEVAEALKDQGVWQEEEATQ